jgi:pimeloyl-ACP methyl ester carboxylesterase
VPDLSTEVNNLDELSSFGNYNYKYFNDGTDDLYYEYNTTSTGLYANVWKDPYKKVSYTNKNYHIINAPVIGDIMNNNGETIKDAIIYADQVPTYFDISGFSYKDPVSGIPYKIKDSTGNMTLMSERKFAFKKIENKKYFYSSFKLDLTDLSYTNINGDVLQCDNNTQLSDVSLSQPMGTGAAYKLIIQDMYVGYDATADESGNVVSSTFIIGDKEKIPNLALGDSAGWGLGDVLEKVSKLLPVHEYDLSGEYIVLVHGLGGPDFMEPLKTALETAGALVSLPAIQVTNGVYDNDASIEASVEVLVAAVETAYIANSSQPVSLIAHSLGGIYGTYAATDERLTTKVKRIVYAGAPIPDVSNLEGYSDRSAAPALPADAFPLIDADFLAIMNASFSTAPPLIFAGPALLAGTNNNTSSLDGKVTILHQEEDWSLGVNVSGCNKYMSEAPSHGIRPRIVRVADNTHFVILTANEQTLDAIWKSIRNSSI